MLPNPQETTDLVTFSEEILMENLLLNSLLKSIVKKVFKFNTTVAKQSSFIHLIIALRARLHETRSELKPVWEFTSG